MRSVLHALVWDNLRYSASTQLMMLTTACLLPIVIYSSILSVAPSIVNHEIDLTGTVDPVMFLLETSMSSFVIFVLVIAAGASHANLAQLATRPISNLSIAAWKVVSGSALLAVETGLIVLLFNSWFHTTWPLAGTVLFTIAVWMTAQPFFCLAGKTILGTAVTMIPIALMGAWFITRYKPLGGGQRDWNEINLSETLQLLAVIALFAWLTKHSVALARCNENFTFPQSFARFWQRLSQGAWFSSGVSKPFRSPSRALFWFSWRWSGWVLSLCMLVLLCVILIAEPFRLISLTGLISAINAACLCTIVPGMFLATVQGFQLDAMRLSPVSGRSASRLSDLDTLGSFQATRPVTDATLARSALAVCLVSVGSLIGTWFVLTSPLALIAVIGHRSEILNTVDPGLSVVPLTALFLWTSSSNFLSIASTGRTKVFVLSIIVGLMLFVGASIVLNWLVSPTTLQSVTRAVWGLLTITLYGFGLWAFARALRLRMIHLREVAVLLLIAVVIVIVCCTKLPHRDWNSIAAMLCIGLLSILPFATTPQALSWNRRR